MALVIEDGSIVAGANSYVTVQDVRDYGIERGLELPALDADLEPKVHLAMDWFEGYSFKWVRVDADQALSFPRSGVTIDRVLYEDTVIPDLVKKIICQAACDAVGLELEPAYAGSSLGGVRSEKLGELVETSYFSQGSQSTERPRIFKLTKMLAPLVDGFASGRLNVNRV